MNGPACAGKTGLFFSENRHDRRLACSICQGCPVLETCLEKALNYPERLYGVWGGLTEDQRRRARTSMRLGRRTRPSAAMCGTDSGYRHHLRHCEPACGACLEAHRVAVAAGRRRTDAA